MISWLNLLTGGALCLSFLLASCSDEQTIAQRCNSVKANDVTLFKTGKVISDRKIILETNEEWGAINSNIPPKLVGNELFIITEKNVVLRYKFKPEGRLKATVFAKFPDVYEMVSDFLPENDSVISFCSNIGIYSISEFNVRTQKLKQVQTDTTMCHSLPFLGLSLQKNGDQFLFPMVRVTDSNEKGNFLSIYNKHKHYEYGLGDFSLFDETTFAPYFDSPVISGIGKGTFYITSTSSNGVIACRLKQEGKKWKLEPSEVLGFSKQTFNRFKGKLTQKDLGDFAKMEKSYVTDSYVMGLYKCGNDLIRVSKREQPFMNPKTATKNSLMNAPWTMEVLNLKNKNGRIHEIEKERFRFTNAFVHQNRFFVLSNQSNQYEIIYYSLR